MEKIGFQNYLRLTSMENGRWCEGNDILILTEMLKSEMLSRVARKMYKNSSVDGN